MMKIIKYRGKRSDTGDWIIGDLLTANGTKCEISDWNDIAYSRYDVLSNTVGQFIDIDTNGREVYGGDIVRIIMENKAYYAVILYDENALTFVAKSKNKLFNGSGFSYLAPLIIHNIPFAVIGNIHDNPELINS